ncbi:putative dsRNA-binding protein [Acaryochloris sp. 'Moss Beach']|uniref:putative dsRNA-binding protein n=1 Tax=Acaryochloris sp. 'Moss Beach' TaxID=2740837 RepID=UPI001F1FEC42|nr:putative dsRNA-binding protein [Acaryochloris sp. 'Moss Beach']
MIAAGVSNLSIGPIGELQELCQRQQISMPAYEFEDLPEGFRCIVRAMGLEGVGEGPSKKQAKVGAAVRVLESIRKSKL